MTATLAGTEGAARILKMVTNVLALKGLRGLIVNTAP